MKAALAGNRLELRKNQMLRMDDARDATIVCVKGELWITQDEDQRDLVVPAGGSFTLDRDGMAVISALEASSVWLQEPHCAGSAARSPVAALWCKLMERMRVFDHPAIELHGQ